MNMMNGLQGTKHASAKQAAGGHVVDLDPRYEFYQDVMRELERAQVPFLVGGGFAFAYFTGIERKIKDLDLFVMPKDFAPAMQVFSDAGFETRIRFAHWLGKALKGEDFVDIIFSSGNGLCRVDESWLDNAVPVEILGLPVKVCSPEEMIWSKAFVMERDRFDGADVAHLIQACGEEMNWSRLLRRFDDNHWRVLFSHLILFGYVYPCERNKIPQWVQGECLRRFRHELKTGPLAERTCRGTLLSWSEYLPDIEQRGYGDGRQPPVGNLTEMETAQLTEVWRHGEGERGR